MEKPIYVTVDVGSYQDNLVKRVSEDYKSKTFGELLEHLTNNGPDELNELGYNANEKKVAEILGHRLSEANRNPGNVNIYAISNTEPPEEIHVSLSDIVSDYNTRIIKYDTELGEGGEELKYQRMDFLVVENASGGLKWQAYKV